MYKLYRFFKDDPKDEQLIGVYRTIRAAKNAAADDLAGRSKYKDILSYRYEEIDEKLTQGQIDEIFRRAKNGEM